MSDDFYDDFISKFSKKKKNTSSGLSEHMDNVISSAQKNDYNNYEFGKTDVTVSGVTNPYQNYLAGSFDWGAYSSQFNSLPKTASPDYIQGLSDEQKKNTIPKSTRKANAQFSFSDEEPMRYDSLSPLYNSDDIIQGGQWTDQDRKNARTVIAGIPKGFIEMAGNTANFIAGLGIGLANLGDAYGIRGVENMFKMDDMYPTDTLNVGARTYADTVAVSNESMGQAKRGFNILTDAILGTNPNQNTMAQKFREEQREDYDKSIEKIDRWSGFNDADQMAQKAGNLLGSASSTAASLFGPVGFFVIFASQTDRSAQTKLAEARANGVEITQEVKDNIMLYSVGSAAVEAASERIFTIGAGKAANIAKEVLEKPMKDFGLHMVKFLIRNGLEEGAEEVVSGLGEGIIAQFTTDKDATFFSIADTSANISLRGLSEQFAGGFLMGSLFSTVSTKSEYKNFTNSRAFYESKVVVDGELVQVKDIPIDKLTKEIQEKGVEAVMKDLANPANVKIAQKKVVETTNEAAVNAPISEQIEVRQKSLMRLYSPNVISHILSSEQEANYKQITRTFEQDIARLRKVKENMDDLGVTHTIDQLERLVPQTQNRISSLETAMNSVAENKTIAAEYQDSINKAKRNLDFLNGEVEIYKQAYEKATGKAFDKIAMPTKTTETTPVMTSAETIAQQTMPVEGATRGVKPFAQKTATEPTQRVIRTAMPQGAAQGTATNAPVTATGQKFSVRAKTAQKTTDKQPQSLDDSVRADIARNTNRVSGIIDALSKSPDATDTTGGMQGIISRGIFAPNIIKPVKSNDYGMSEETTESMKRTANVDSTQKTVGSALKEVINFVGNPNLGSVEVSNKYGDFKRAIRKSRTAFSNASAIAIEIINKCYGPLNAKQLDLFKKSLLFFDIRENIERGLYKNAPLPHKLKSIDEALEIAEKIEKDFNLEENLIVRNAYKERKRLMDSVRDELIEKGDAVGLDLSFIKNREYYVYNAAYEMLSATQRNSKNKDSLKYKKRKGTAAEYLSDPVKCDYLILSKLIRDTYRLEVIDEVSRLDIMKNISFDRDTGLPILPDGYVIANKNALVGNAGITSNIESNATRAALDVLAEAEIDFDSAVGNKILKNARKLEKSVSMVIPTSVYNAITEEFAPKQKNLGQKTFRLINRVWKFTKTRTPFVAWKYNYRNWMGDLEMVFTGYPKAIAKVPRAVYEMFQYFYMNNRTNKNVMNFLEKTGGLSGQTIQEMGEFEKHPDLSFLYGSATPMDWTKHAAKKVWGALTLEKFTNYREQILRYAAYLSIKGDLSKNKGVVKEYLASSRAEIDTIRNIDDKAIKLANDLLGSYDDISKAGQMIADNLIPFFRFKEISVKRYIRLVNNAFYIDGEVVNKTGAIFAKKLGMSAKIGAVGTLKLGRIGIRIGLYLAALAASNNLFGGDDEDKLPEDVRNQPHILFPSGLFGDNSRVFYLSNIGIFTEILGTAGIDYGEAQLIVDMFTGKKTWDEVMEEVSIGITPARLIFSISPILMQGYELASGKKGYYFDPENPSEIRDRWQYFFQQAGFGPVYTWLAKLPANPSTQGVSALANSVASGDAAMWAVWDMQEDYYAENDISQYKFSGYERDSIKWKKSNAAYYYKMAIKLNDKDAIVKYLSLYVSLGGTKDTMNASFSTMEPLHFMSKKDKKKFLAQLTDEEKEKLEEAKEYYQSLSKENADILNEYENLFDDD